MEHLDDLICDSTTLNAAENTIMVINFLRDIGYPVSPQKVQICHENIYYIM